MAKTYEPIATTTLGSAAASYTFSSIPATYTDLVLIVSNLTTSSASQTMYMRYNADSTTIYSNTQLLGDGTAAISQRSTLDTGINIGGQVGGTSTTEPSTIIINIMNYANATTYKTNLTRFSRAGAETDAVVGLWRSTAAISSVLVKPYAGNLNTGTVLTLYGIKSA